MSFQIELSMDVNPAIFNSLDNDELLSAIDHYHDKLPPLLAMMRDRFELLVDEKVKAMAESVPCPSCGTKIRVKVTPVS